MTVPELQRLGVQDALWLEMDKPTNLMVVDYLMWTATPIDWDRYRAVMRKRFWERYPVFRSVARRGADGGWYWEELAGDDFEAHVQRVVLPEPGDDAALQDLIATQRTMPLDRDRPLWQAFLIDGYRGGSAVVVRAHHAIADGIRIVQLTLSIADPSPDGGPLVMPLMRQQNAIASTSGQPVLSEMAARAMSLPGDLGELARTAVRNPVAAVRGAADLATSALESTTSLLLAPTRSIGGRWLDGLFAAVPGDVDIVRKLLLGTRNDSTCWTGTAGTRKAVSWSAPLPLADVKQVARANNATINDVLVTCVAATLRAYLQKHHAECASVNWDVPVNLRPFDATLPTELGNSFAIVQLELPTNIADPLVVLDVVRRRMRRIKNGHEAAVAFTVQEGISKLNKGLYRAVVDILADRAVGVLTNVPGPQVPLYIAGQKVEGAMGWAPLSGNQAMSFTITSYDGKVFVGIACDVGLVPDHEQIVHGFTDAFHRMSVLSV